MSGKVDLYNHAQLPFDLLLKVSSLTRFSEVEESIKKGGFICTEMIKMSFCVQMAIQFIVSNIEIIVLIHNSLFPLQ